MIELLSIEELIGAIESVDGRILIPDKDVNWLWDGLNHQYHEMEEGDRDIIVSCFETRSIQSRRRVVQKEHGDVVLKEIFVPVLRSYDGARIVIKLSVDETSQSRDERSNLDLHRRYSTVVTNAPDAVVTINGDGLIQSWNLAAENTFGYAADVLINQSAAKLFQDAGFLDVLMRQEVAPDHPCCLKKDDVECVTMDGRHIFCEVTAVRIQIESNQFEMALFLRDKTIQKRLQEQAQRSLENISKINEISSLIHASIDLDEILNMVLVAATAGQGLRFNRAFLLLSDEQSRYFEGRKAIGPSNPHEAGLLWQELEASLQTLSQILTSYKSMHDGRDFRVNQIVKKIRIPIRPAADDPENLQSLYDAIATHRPVVFTQDQPDLPTSLQSALETAHFAVAPLVSKDGPVGLLIVDNAITGRLISPEDLATLELFSNQIVAALEKAMLYDKLRKKVDELEKAQSSLRKSQKHLIRSEKLAAIGKLSAKMAHEIRNPLVAIGGFAKTMLKADDVYNRSYLQIISAETTRLESILNDTLAYVRSSQPVMSTQKLRPLVEQTLELLSERIRNNQIEVHTEWQDESDLEFDPNQIKQTIVNILTNAVEAMPKGGDIFITLTRDDGSVSLCIRDTGEGIDEQNLTQIFDPFFTTKNKGSGIGLAVVHDILMRHGVEYDVVSSKDQGTSFHLRFKIPS